MINDWDLTSTNLKRIGQHKYEVAVISTCAIEPHNKHLPEGQDFLHTKYVAEQSCRLAWGKSQSIICLPALPFGVDCNLMDFPMAIHVSQTSLDNMVKDIILSLRKHGIRKVVIINGHGGNDFRPLIRQFQCDTDVHIFLCDWWRVGSDKYDEIFDLVDDHAGQFETSVAMHLFPELVEIENAGSGKTKPFRFEALEKGWVSTSRNFSRLNDHCATASPEGASTEKGARYLELVCGRISEFLVQLANEPIDGEFPHKARE